MSDELSGEPEDRQESILKNCAAAASDGYEGIKPADSKRVQREIDEIVERIREFEAKLKSLDKEMSISAANKVSVSIDREKLLGEQRDIREQRERLIEERKQFDVELRELNTQVQKKNDACTKLQAGVRYKSESRIDEAVRRLEHQMQAQQLTLSEEKRLVAEIDMLKRSKRNLKDYLNLKQVVDQLRNRQTNVRGQRDACVRRINGLKSREEKIKNLLDSDNSKEIEGTHESQLAELMKQKEGVKKELTELRSKKKIVKDTHAKERNEYYAALKEMRAQKQKEELARRTNERLVMLQELESKRAKQCPYEKEKALCDTLIGLFEKLQLKTFHSSDVSASTAADKEPGLSPRADAEFFSPDGEGTFLRRKSASDDLVGLFAGTGRTSRRGSRKGRRSSSKEVTRKLNLHPEVVENLLVLHLSPPSTVADIPKVIQELQEKKVFYERGPISHAVLPPSNNDPMSPITEELAPKFPREFVKSSVAEKSEELMQDEGASAATDRTEHEGVQNNSQGNDGEVNKTATRVKVAEAATESKSSCDTLNSTAQETERKTAGLKSTELQSECCVESSCHSIDSVVADTNLTESACQNFMNFSNELLSNKCNAPGPVNQEPFAFDGAVSDLGENVQINSEEEQVSLSDIKQKDEVIPKQSSVVQEVQSHIGCIGSSTHNSNLLVDKNDLDATFERNTLNEGGTMVKMHCEKCPA